MLEELELRRIAMWRSGQVTYCVHAAQNDRGEQATVINAFGPGEEHRFIVIWDDAPHGWMVQWNSRDEAERTASAEALLSAA